LAKNYAKDFMREEMMVAAAAREIKDGEVVLVGVGLPLIVAILAKRTHAPNAILVTEIGVVDARTPAPPVRGHGPMPHTRSCHGLLHV